MAVIVTNADLHISPGRVRHGVLQSIDGRITDQDVPVEVSTIIEAAGSSVVPLLVDTVFTGEAPPSEDSFDLLPGNPATFAVTRGSVGVTAIRNMLIVDPEDLEAVVIHGRLAVRKGVPVRPAGTDDLHENDPRLGAWTDPTRDMTQYLSRDGRYSETRQGRRNAFTGRFWLDADRITYLDDTGFWAFGQYHQGILHHAGFVLRPGTH